MSVVKFAPISHWGGDWVVRPTGYVDFDVIVGIFSVVVVSSRSCCCIDLVWSLFLVVA